MIQLQSTYRGDHKSMFIVPLGDIHLGNKFTDLSYLERALAFADKHRNRCRIILMGDVLELATKSSVGRGVYDENYPTQMQYEKAVEIFKPYADIIDMVVEGNHEERIIRDTSFEIVSEFCHRIGRPDAYAKFGGLININMVNDMSYSIYAWHGSTGGTRESSAINALLNMRERALAHIYLMGHTHKLLNFSREVYLPDGEGDTPATMTQLFVNTGTCLGDGGYGAQKGFPLNRIGFCAIEVFSDERKHLVHLIDDLI